ncbi:hypothetical protein [Microcoleus sp. bin38.metabat.b11b12b14.051]|uniref:hypothetical protein n=1 Tax=Microcoleus sp. bin38.metabat.b11b12b14.051 TaxID=2742709 RepID=UPI0025E5B72D|nr:hypothetical protein [Microcoleus sp. bin38.metabat.b11b12b14.051]
MMDTQSLCQNFQEIDVFCLPSVAFENRRQLPNESGVYFFIVPFFDNKVIYYIGSTFNLKLRLNAGHEQMKRIPNKSKLTIAYLKVPGFNRQNFHALRVLEEMLIERFNPIFNKRGKWHCLNPKETRSMTLTITANAWESLSKAAKDAGCRSIETFLEKVFEIDSAQK